MNCPSRPPRRALACAAMVAVVFAAQSAAAAVVPGHHALASSRVVAAAPFALQAAERQACSSEDQSACLQFVEPDDSGGFRCTGTMCCQLLQCLPPDCYSELFDSTTLEELRQFCPDRGFPFESSSSSLSVGAIVGIVVGVLLVLIAVGVLIAVILILRRREGKPAQAPGSAPQPPTSTTLAGPGPAAPVYVPAYAQPPVYPPAGPSEPSAPSAPSAGEGALGQPLVAGYGFEGQQPVGYVQTYPAPNSTVEYQGQPAQQYPMAPLVEEPMPPAVEQPRGETPQRQVPEHEGMDSMTIPI